MSAAFDGEAEGGGKTRYGSIQNGIDIDNGSVGDDDVVIRQPSKTRKVFGVETYDIPWKIYLSRALSAWGDRMWSYGSGLFMTSLDENGSLRVVSIYGFVTCASIILLGPVMGNWIDRSNRLTSAQVFLAIQNLAVATAGICLGLYFWQEEWILSEWGSSMVSVIGGVTIVVGTVANLGSQGSKIVIERDWIVVVARRDNNRLAAMNSVFRTIDLTCLVLAPAILGLFWDFLSSEVAAFFITGWNLVSVIVEYTLLVQIYKQFPDLSRKEHLEQVRSRQTEKPFKEKLKDVFRSWRLYFWHPVRNAGFALACLYMTVLGFDNITVGFCLHQCVPASLLGALMGVSSAIGIVGSISFPYLRRWLGLLKTGLIGFIALTVSLLPAVGSIVMPGSPWELYWDVDEDRPPYDEDAECQIDSYASVSALLTSLCLARFGLWVSDITVTQIMQESVLEEYRGTIGGVQSGLNYFMDLIKFSLVIALPNDDTFGYLILSSFVAIALGGVSYASYIFSPAKVAAAAEIAAKTQMKNGHSMAEVSAKGEEQSRETTSSSDCGNEEKG